MQYRQPPSQNIQEHFNSRKAAFFHVKMRTLFAIAVFYSELALALAGVLFRVMFLQEQARTKRLIRRFRPIIYYFFKEIAV